MSHRGNGSEVSENEEARGELEGAFYETSCMVEKPIIDAKI